MAEKGKHADAAVLELDETEALEALLVSVLQETKGIVESEGGLDAELLLEGIESGLGLGDLGGHKGGGRAEDGGKDGSGLHGSRVVLGMPHKPLELLRQRGNAAAAAWGERHRLL